MTKFEKACLLSCNEWASSLPDSPEYTLSRKGEKRLLSIVEHMDGSVSRRFPKRVVRSILVAAVISALLIATTVFAVIGQNEFNIFRRSDMSEYSVNGSSAPASSGDLTVSYVVDGFELTETHYNGDIISDLVFQTENGDSYVVSKLINEERIIFDTEEYEAQKINIDGIDYTYYKSIDNYNGLIWNYGGNIYTVFGNIDLNEALNVAKSTK